MNNDQTQMLDVVEPSALEAIERASIDVQIATAHRFPRTLSRVKADMLSFATLDEETAASCFYTLPRGGKAIQGPSVRLAEIALACYGNLRAGARVIQTVTTGENPHVVIQAVAHDLEKNVAITIEKRRRITKKKNKDRLDDDDIQLACNAGGSIAFRDAVFKVVPLALIKPVYEQAKQVAVGKATSLVEKRTKIIDRLKQMGATEERILAVVEARKIDDIDLAKLEILIGLGTALKDGDTTLEEAFPISKPASDVKAAGPAAGIGAAAGTTPTEPKAPSSSVEELPEWTPEKRAALIDEMKNALLDNGVSETRLWDYAKTGKHVPEGVDELWALPSDVLAKLKFAIKSLKGGGAR